MMEHMAIDGPRFGEETMQLSIQVFFKHTIPSSNFLFGNFQGLC